MLFHTLEFAVFFPIVFGLYLLLRHVAQNRMLLLASYIFYGSWDWRYLSLLLTSTTVDYFCGLGIERSEARRTRKAFVSLSVIANLSILCTFKYYDFFLAGFQEMAGGLGLSFNPVFLNVALPIGISFYTFQTMSYTLDVYAKKLPATRNFLDFALYVSFFPQLIAGPIERGVRLLPQILKPRTVTPDKIIRGSYFVVWGLFLKVVVADNLAKLVDPVFVAAPAYNGGDVLIAVYAFSFQIYGDFAGYSLMALGFALAMGIDLMENFKRPYFSKNIGEFWRRWHISLSSWFRDYVFSPLYVHIERYPVLGRLPLKLRHGIAFFSALMIAQYMLGLWHGAGWNFGFFGLYHALAIWAYYLVQKSWKKLPAAIQILLTYQIACGGWLVFRSDSLGQAWRMFRDLFADTDAAPVLAPRESIITLLALVSLPVAMHAFQHLKDDTLAVMKTALPIKIMFFAFVPILILLFGDFGDRPFIYFQF